MSSSDADDTLVPISELTIGHRLSARLQGLQEFYVTEFGSPPQFFVRVPGRVNIIGEHVDYCGYPVLPMAIDQCIILAVGYNPDNTCLQLRNTQSEKFANFECDLKTFIIEQLDGPKWYKYYLCGVKGIYETLEANDEPIGMRIALNGNVPPASGLSSSSALVSAAALATAYVQKVPLKCKQLASISACCEQYIGTQGGGMDQAIAYLAKAGCAQFIEFYPKLNATPIQLPDGACFVVANSLAEVNKAASSAFNERVVECRLGSRIIAKRSELISWRELTRFALLQEALKCTLNQLEELILKYLTKEIYTREEICKELDIKEDEFDAEYLTANTHHMKKFKLRQRALHVIQESLRVCEFRRICENRVIINGNFSGNCKFNTGYGDDGQDTKLKTLSQLMRQSHRSLKDLYECSQPDLDKLVALSDSLGVGARLTGAGWGGCIVALCDSIETSAKYIRELKDKYYSQLPPHILQAHQHNDFADVVFPTFPGDGAEIFTAV